MGFIIVTTIKQCQYDKEPKRFGLYPNLVEVVNYSLWNYKPKETKKLDFILGESNYQKNEKIKEEEKQKRVVIAREIYRTSDNVNQYADLINKYSEQFGADKEWMFRVMNCESGGNLYAENPSGATGLYQFMKGTFYGNAPKAGIENPDIWNAEHQIITASYMNSIGQQGQWECK